MKLKKILLSLSLFFINTNNIKGEEYYAVIGLKTVQTTIGGTENANENISTSDPNHPLNNNCKRLTIEYKSDNFPEESSWELSREGTVITTSEAYVSGISTDTLFLRNGDYIIKVKDSYGDGLTEGNPTGYFDIKLDSGNILSITGQDGGFNELSSNFTISTADTGEALCSKTREGVSSENGGSGGSGGSGSTLPPAPDPAADAHDVLALVKMIYDANEKYLTDNGYKVMTSEFKDTVDEEAIKNTTVQNLIDMGYLTAPIPNYEYLAPDLFKITRTTEEYIESANTTYTTMLTHIIVLFQDVQLCNEIVILSGETEPSQYLPPSINNDANSTKSGKFNCYYSMMGANWFDMTYGEVTHPEF